MRRLVGFTALFFLLGCSGLAEGLAELISGSDIDVEDDGTVVMTNADGSTQRITQGEHAVRPDDFALPAPPGELTLDSVMIADGNGASTLTYRLSESDDADAVITFYTDWFAQEGIAIEADSKNMAGMKTTAMVGSSSGAVYSVTFTDALGTRMLTLAVTPAP